MGLDLQQARSESQWIVTDDIVGISYYLNKCYMQDSALEHCVQNTVQLLQHRTFNLLSPEL